MTQKMLAKRVGVSRQTMNAIENSRHAPTVAAAIRIADVFHVTVDDLFDLDYDGKPSRLGQTTTVAMARSSANAEKPIETESRHESVLDKKERPASLADLRNIIGT